MLKLSETRIFQHMIRAQYILLIIAFGILFNSCRKDDDRNSPQASFSYKVLNCDSPWQIKLYNYSENAENYEWYGPNGWTSNEEDPTITIAGNGPFDIRLVAIKGKRNRQKTDELSKSIDPIYETAVELPIIRWIIQSCTPPYAVHLGASGTIYHEQLWRFHDGSTSTQSSVNMTYPAMGQYIVELGNIRCGDTAWATATVDISELTTLPKSEFEITEAFEFEPDVFLAGSRIIFENTTELADHFVWVYPGGTSSGTHLDITLPAGLHNIELQAWCGNNVDTKSMQVHFAYPNGLHINEFVLQGVPPFAWDILDPVPNSPDMYLGLFAGSTQIGSFTPVHMDYQQGSTVSWEVDFDCMDINQVYTIVGYDDDPLLDQFVEEADFSLLNVFQSNPGTLPDCFSVENQGFVVKVCGEWQ